MNPQRNTSYAAERSADIDAVDISKTESTLRLADHHFTDLYDRRKIGVVGNIAHDLRRVRPEAFLKRLDRIAIDMAHANVGGSRAGRAAGKTLVHRIELAGIAHFFLHQRHMG